MTEHEEHIVRRLADGWYAIHFCKECQQEKQKEEEYNFDFSMDDHTG